MNCYKHPDVAAVAFCRTCGRPLCQSCQQAVQGTIVCEEHAPQRVVVPPPEPVHPGTSPGLAFVLGLIPGVGAIYNGQYAKVSFTTGLPFEGEYKPVGVMIENSAAARPLRSSR
jgi:hypothetical protein